MITLWFVEIDDWMSTLIPATKQNVKSRDQDGLRLISTMRVAAHCQGFWPLNTIWNSKNHIKASLPHRAIWEVFLQGVEIRKLIWPLHSRVKCGHKTCVPIWHSQSQGRTESVAEVSWEFTSLHCLSDQLIRLLFGVALALSKRYRHPILLSQAITQNNVFFCNVI